MVQLSFRTELYVKLHMVILFPSDLYGIQRETTEILNLLVSIRRILVLHLKLMINYKYRNYNEQRPPSAFCFD